MPNIKLMESGLPVAPLKIGALESCRELGEKVNDYIVQFRKSTMDKNTDSPLYYNYLRDNYLIDCPCPRFGSGEAKGLLTESIRGTDLFLMVDVCNHSLTYSVNGHLNALYCFDKKGIMQKSGWITTDDGKAYLSDDGKALIGWQTIDGKDYYFDSKGIAATGEIKLGLEKCKFSESGELLSKEKTEIDPGKPMVALTFDDGPGPRTSEILDQLKKYNAHATFFMLGKNVKSYPDAVKQMLKDGNELGNHSYDHQQLTKIDAEAIAKEVNDTNENIKNICGSLATVLRPPYGAINDTVKSSVGMPMILWNVDTLDWKTRNTQSTIDEVMRNLKDGDIILMHDIHTQTVDAALQLIPKLEEEGYQLVTVSEMAAAKNKTLEYGTAYSDFISASKK